jgi:hypothetical protein
MSQADESDVELLAEPDANVEAGVDAARDLDAEVLAEAIGRGQAADEAGGSVASAIRIPH